MAGACKSMWQRQVAFGMNCKELGSCSMGLQFMSSVTPHQQFGQHITCAPSTAMPDTSICCDARPVVVLADREKEEMDDELRHSLKGYKIEWHTRSGAPHCSSDLDRVAAGQAKNVILLDDNTEVGCLHIVSLLLLLPSLNGASPSFSRYSGCT